MEIEDINEIKKSVIPNPSNNFKKSTVETAEMTIATILLPMRTVDKALSNLSNILMTSLADFLPSSASTCVLKRLQQDNAVSLAEKKK